MEVELEMVHHIPLQIQNRPSQVLLVRREQIYVVGVPDLMRNQRYTFSSPCHMQVLHAMVSEGHDQLRHLEAEITSDIQSFFVRIEKGLANIKHVIASDVLPENIHDISMTDRLIAFPNVEMDPISMLDRPVLDRVLREYRPFPGYTSDLIKADPSIEELFHRHDRDIVDDLLLNRFLSDKSLFLVTCFPTGSVVYRVEI